MTLDGENVVCKENNEVKLRLPFSNIEAIFCFSYLGCSPALMGKCADYGIPINFISPSGRFLARVQGASHGNVLLRKRQYELFSKPPALLRQNTVAAKLANTKSVVKRTLKDYPQIDEDGKLTHCLERLDLSVSLSLPFVFADLTNDELSISLTHDSVKLWTSC